MNDAPQVEEAETRCPACGASGAARMRDPTVGLGFVLLGAGVCADALRGAWDPGLDGIHSVLGGTVLAAALWGLISDVRALGPGGAARGSGFWVEVRTSCGQCGHRQPAAGDLTILRGLLGFAVVAYVISAIVR